MLEEALARSSVCSFERNGRMEFVILMLVVAAVGAGAYVALFMTHVPGAMEERFGKLEPLPEDLGKWVREETPTEEGLIAERRHLYRESTGLGGDKLLLQVRYRDPTSNEIVRVEPERVIKRKRVRS